MILDILAETGTQSIFGFYGLLIILVYVPIFALIVMGLIRLVRYLGSAGREQKLLRIEVTKLAEEVHLLRQGLERDKDSDSAVR